MEVKKVGKSIAFLRKQYNLTQKELAERLGISDKAVSKWERGLGAPDISLLTRLSIILDVDIESILEGNLTHLEHKWKGILVLNYPEEMYAFTLLYDKPLVDFQLSLFMLAGIKEILIRGRKIDILFLKNRIKDGSRLGIQITYEVTSGENEGFNKTKETPIFREYNRNNGVLVIAGLDFLYGKDITKYFRRVFCDSTKLIRLTSFFQKPTSIYFCPRVRDHSKEKIELTSLERGVITFPIKSGQDLLDASNIVRILQSQQEEKIADLKEIAFKRGLIAREE